MTLGKGCLSSKGDMCDRSECAAVQTVHSRSHRRQVHSKIQRNLNCKLQQKSCNRKSMDLMRATRPPWPVLTMAKQAGWVQLGPPHRHVPPPFVQIFGMCVRCPGAKFSYPPSLTSNVVRGKGKAVVHYCTCAHECGSKAYNTSDRHIQEEAYPEGEEAYPAGPEGDFDVSQAIVSKVDLQLESEPERQTAVADFMQSLADVSDPIRLTEAMAKLDGMISSDTALAESVISLSEARQLALQVQKPTNNVAAACGHAVITRACTFQQCCCAQPINMYSYIL